MFVFFIPYLKRFMDTAFFFCALLRRITEDTSTRRYWVHSAVSQTFQLTVLRIVRGLMEIPWKYVTFSVWLSKKMKRSLCTRRRRIVEWRTGSLILNLGTRLGWVFGFTRRQLDIWGKSPLPLTLLCRCVDGPQSRSGRFERGGGTLASAWNRSTVLPSFQPV